MRFVSNLTFSFLFSEKIELPPRPGLDLLLRLLDKERKVKEDL